MPSATVCSSLVPLSEIDTEATSSVVAPSEMLNVMLPSGVTSTASLPGLTEALSAGSAGTLTVPVKYLPGMPS